MCFALLTGSTIEGNLKDIGKSIPRKGSSIVKNVESFSLKKTPFRHTAIGCIYHVIPVYSVGRHSPTKNC